MKGRKVCVRVWCVAALVMATFLAGCGAGGGRDGRVKVFLTGGDLSAWREDTGQWQVVGSAAMEPQDQKKITTLRGDGVMVNGPKGRTVHLFSRQEFGDIQAHIEFMVPKGSNSGVYFMGRYEIQIRDDWGQTEPTYAGNEGGGIYQRWDDGRDPKGYEGRSPRVTVGKAPGEWQSFDVVFRGPRFDEAGRKIANALFERVVHNGVVVHEGVEVTGPTRAAAFDDEKPTGPLMLQGDHGPVAYRNIWVIPLDVQGD